MRDTLQSSRRQFLTSATAATTGIIAGVTPASALSATAAPGPAEAEGMFPKGFLWGAATAAHQVEGQNINSDNWLLENMKSTIFIEPSNDTCDHYNQFAQDIALLKSLGLNSYRFSIEWARIEPEPGMYSYAQLEHYRKMLATCREMDLTPNVTFSHFTNPRWFAGLGGWENPNAGDLFIKYVERSAKHLGDLIGMAVPFNEPNAVALIPWLPLNPAMAGMAGMFASMMQVAAKKNGTDKFTHFFFSNPKVIVPAMIAAHHRARDVMKSGPGNYPVGAILAMSDDQPDGEDTRGRDRKRLEVYGAWLEAASKSDFLGVQVYTRARVGLEHNLPPAPGVELNQNKDEFYPEALGGVIKYAAPIAKVPIYVTENGVPTADDTRRVEYIHRSLKSMKECTDAGIDVRGYFHWSLLDNWEWNSGFAQTYGLVAVDRKTLKRTVKPSAYVLGNIAKRNSLA